MNHSSSIGHHRQSTTIACPDWCDRGRGHHDYVRDLAQPGLVRVHAGIVYADPMLGLQMVLEQAETAAAPHGPIARDTVTVSLTLNDETATLEPEQLHRLSQAAANAATTLAALRQHDQAHDQAHQTPDREAER